MPSEETTFRTVTDEGLERVLLVSVNLQGDSSLEADLAEMTRLVESAGGTVAATASQSRHRPDPGTFVGSGKVEELAALARSEDVSTLVFDHNLSPGQVGRLERSTECKVIDRTELILAIFALQARTPQAKLRIELAQLKYMLPRLSGMWHHLDRLGAGIGTRGPGETQLEVDRRRARTRISALEARLERVESGSRTRRKLRSGMFSVALAGYTNAGKSTLLNRLCGSSVRSEDRLFATLDATARRLELPGGETVVMSDTVGFIRNLPPMLLDSFRSTLDAVTEADLILLVADASDPERATRVNTVTETLRRIGAGEIPRLLVWNKLDLPEASVDGGIGVSALRGTGIESLLMEIQTRRREALDWCVLNMDICPGDVENWIRKNAVTGGFHHSPDGGTTVTCGFFLGARGAARYLKGRGISFSMKETDAVHR